MNRITQTAQSPAVPVVSHSEGEHSTQHFRNGQPDADSRAGVWSNAFYDESSKEYLWPKSGGGWVRVTEGSLRKHLRSHGVSPNKGDQPLSDLDYAVNEIQLENAVQFAGPLAGHRAGVYQTEDGGRLLVTNSPALIEPEAGSWETIRALAEGLFRDREADQTPYLYGWLKVATESLRSGNFRTGQALVVAGKKGCGKSLFQNLITRMLGGRSAKPYQYMTGGTAFNGELFAAEHLMVEDEVPSTDMRARRGFGTLMKGIAANETHRYHPKGRQAINLRPFWRLTVTVNDEPENLMVLPPIDESMEDKMIILRANYRAMPNEEPERSNHWKALNAELPAFLDYLMRWEMPAGIRGGRFGVKHYHHPELIQSLNSLSNEAKLWALIKSTVLKDSESWRGSAQSLENELTRESSPVAYEARKLLSYSTACGVYLGRLAQMMSEGTLLREQTRDGNFWTIRRQVAEG